jgi:hypothetical protein
MRLGIAEILQKASEMRTENEKVDWLRKNDNIAIRMLLKMGCDKDLKWALPEGDPPYKPCPFDDQESMLFNEVRRMYIFHEGGNPNLKPKRREELFVQMLESIDKEDAKLVLGIKNKKIPFKGITPRLINKAWPGLIDKE